MMTTSNRNHAWGEDGCDSFSTEQSYRLHLGKSKEYVLKT